MNSYPGSAKDAKDIKAHSVNIENRKDVRIDGVSEVLGFDEDFVNLVTSCGEMTVEGSDLRVGTIDVEKGFVRISGNVNGMYYSDREEKKRRRKFGTGSNT